MYQYFTPKLETQDSPKLDTPENLLKKMDNSVLIAGIGNQNGITSPRADLLAELAAYYPNHAVPPTPFYIRPPDAKLPDST